MSSTFYHIIWLVFLFWWSTVSLALLRQVTTPLRPKNCQKVYSAFKLYMDRYSQRCFIYYKAPTNISPGRLRIAKPECLCTRIPSQWWTQHQPAPIYPYIYTPQHLHIYKLQCPNVYTQQFRMSAVHIATPPL